MVDFTVILAELIEAIDLTIPVESVVADKVFLCKTLFLRELRVIEDENDARSAAVVTAEAPQPQAAVNDEPAKDVEEPTSLKQELMIVPDPQEGDYSWSLIIQALEFAAAVAENEIVTAVASTVASAATSAACAVADSATGAAGVVAHTAPVVASTVADAATSAAGVVAGAATGLWSSFWGGDSSAPSSTAGKGSRLERNI